ncbi:hypothetical protein QJS10_CPB21g00273 [Acorus calamus]|uniref:Uncharacterized protein n=1 Tax=Acorus calamus TaxID=4465 RepID=A0AAV9C741_ACOCL|nr:hypothetical protein QJS10_CPB21g00273 [Acorus calamus]
MVAVVAADMVAVVAVVVTDKAEVVEDMDKAEVVKDMDKAVVAVVVTDKAVVVEDMDKAQVLAVAEVEVVMGLVMGPDLAVVMEQVVQGVLAVVAKEFTRSLDFLCQRHELGSLF